MASDGSYIPAEVSRNICIHFSRCAQFCVCIFLSQCSSWGLRRYHVCLAILRWSDLRKCDVSLAGKKLSSPSSWQGTEIVRGRAYAWRYHCKLGHSSIPLRRFEILTALNYWGNGPRRGIWRRPFVHRIARKDQELVKIFIHNVRTDNGATFSASYTGDGTVKFIWGMSSDS